MTKCMGIYTELSHVLWEGLGVSYLRTLTPFCSVPQLCPTLWESMNCSKSGFPVHHQLPELAQTYVHWVSDAIQPSHSLSSLSLSAFSLSQWWVFSKANVKPPVSSPCGVRTHRPPRTWIQSIVNQQSLPEVQCPVFTEISLHRHDGLNHCPHD